MPDLTLDLRYLRYAIVAAEHGSFRRAALILDLPQSTVSRRIQLLEHRLKMKLFERSPAGATLTTSGKRFLENAAVGASEIARAARDIADDANGNRGTINIGIVASLSTGILSELIDNFRQTYPQIELRIDEGTIEKNVARLTSRSMDIALVAGEPDIVGCKSRFAWNERVYFALPTGHSLSSEDVITWEQVRNERFIVNKTGLGSEVENCLIKRLASFGFKPEIQPHGVTHENLMAMVGKGFGIALTTESAIGNVYRGVVFRPADQRALVPYWALWMNTNTNPALKRLIESFSSLADNAMRTS